MRRRMFDRMLHRMFDRMFCRLGNLSACMLVSGPQPDRMLRTSLPCVTRCIPVTKPTYICRAIGAACVLCVSLRNDFRLRPSDSILPTPSFRLCPSDSVLPTPSFRLCPSDSVLPTRRRSGSLQVFVFCDIPKHVLSNVTSSVPSIWNKVTAASLDELPPALQRLGLLDTGIKLSAAPLPQKTGRIGMNGAVAGRSHSLSSWPIPFVVFLAEPIRCLLGVLPPNAAAVLLLCIEAGCCTKRWLRQNSIAYAAPTVLRDCAVIPRLRCGSATVARQCSARPQWPGRDPEPKAGRRPWLWHRCGRRQVGCSIECPIEYSIECSIECPIECLIECRTK